MGNRPYPMTRLPMRSEEVLQRLTDGIPGADTLQQRLHTDMKDAPQELRRIQDLVQLMLVLQSAILTHGGPVQRTLELRRARLFSILAPELPGPHQQERCGVEHHSVERPKKRAQQQKLRAPRLPNIKTAEEALEILRTVCAKEGLPDLEIFTQWEVLAQLGRKYPDLDQAIMFLSR
jgi:hypothetical protein